LKGLTEQLGVSPYKLLRLPDRDLSGDSSLINQFLGRMDKVIPKLVDLPPWIRFYIHLLEHRSVL